MSAARGGSGPAGGMREMPEIDAAVISALFSESPFSLYVLDPELRLVRFNPAAGRVRDFPIADMIGRPASEVLPLFRLDRPQDAARYLMQVLETGTPVLNERFKARSDDPEETESEHSVSFLRLHGPDGAVLGVVVSVLDVTERVAAEARLRLLNHTSTHIGTTLDVYQTAKELCDECVPHLADAIAVDVLDSLLRGEAPAPGAVIRGQLLRRAGFRSATGRPGVTAVGEGVSYPFDTPYDHVLSKLRSQLIPRLDPSAGWLERDPRGRRLRETGVRSMMTVPLAARGLVLGVASFYRWHNPADFDAADLELAEQIAGGAALCLDNARLYTRERSVARLLGPSSDQRPAEESVRSAVETAHVYLAAGVGEAWFDVIALSGSRVALVVGDSTGLGMRAAAAMSEMRAASSALSGLDLLPDEILERLHIMADKPDRTLQPGGGPGPGAAGIPRETCLYAVYDPATRICTAASAGHAAPFVAYADGRVEELDIPQGPPLGHGAAQYTASEHVLPEGAVLLLHNDGSLRLEDGGTASPYVLLARAAAAPGTSLRDACDEFKGATAPTPPERDVIVLLARTHALDASQTESWTLAPSAEAPGQARKLAAAQLADWGIEALGYSTELVVSELVTNAVQYAEGPIRLRLIRDRALITEVTDDSSTAPRLRRAQDDDEGGRGLFITEQLTERWGARPNRHGKTIWAEQSLADPAALDDTASGP